MKVFLISHTHWDREWYLTREKSRFMLIELVDGMLTLLDEQPDYVFMLDGQTIVLEDYLEIRPEREEEIIALVKAGRLLIGPWYVLADDFLISGESHIRNYLVGRNLCREFGGNMNLGYLPDSFGHPEQMPQILKGLGLNEIIFWRGLGPAITKSEFIWEGKDGTEIFSVNMPFSYGNAACMPENGESFTERLKSEIARLEPLTDSNTILLMNGVDHVAPQESLLANLEYAQSKMPEHELIQGTLHDYLAALKEDATVHQKMKGQLRSGYRTYILGGTISTRMYLKQARFRAENLLEKYAEPLSAIVSMRFEKKYPEAQLRHAWKLSLSNMAHDSICGCSIDQVHEEMMQRCHFVEDLGQSILEQASSAIRENVGRSNNSYDGSFVAFNPLVHRRDDIVRVSLVTDERLLRKVNYETGNLDEYVPRDYEEVPTGVVLHDSQGNEFTATIHSIVEEDGMHLSLRSQPEMFRGRKVDFSFVAKGLPSVGYSIYNYNFVYEKAGAIPQRTEIENDCFKIAFDKKSSSLTVYDKRISKSYEGLHVFENTGDAGDEYTYSRPLNDSQFGLLAESVHVRIEGNDDFPTMLMEGILRVPARLSSDRKTRSSEMKDVKIKSWISLSRGIARIDIRTEIQNDAEDQRIRVLFPADVEVNRAIVRSEGIFSVNEHPLVSEVETSYSDWVEQPSTNPHKTFVSISDDIRGIAIANRGLPEYEVLRGKRGESVIALTLIRSVGWLSRPDLLARKGNSGWTIPTPEAQCRGKYVFEYSIIPHHGTWQENEVIALAHEFAVPVLAFKLGDAGTRDRPEEYSLLSVDRSEIILSAIKKSEDRHSYIVRCWNTSGNSLVATFHFGCPARSVFRTNHAEMREEEISVVDKEWSVHFEPWKIVSMEVEI
ncbi:MAG: hypothetical protein KAU31_03325 [Spirochaetaceae bacterium]|nr:hypothetical protein [Spirochaetaceae bacterium]